MAKEENSFTVDGFPQALNEMYFNDPTMAKIVQIVRNQMQNLFQGTDPESTVMGNNKGVREIRISRIIDQTIEKDW